VVTAELVVLPDEPVEPVEPVEVPDEPVVVPDVLVVPAVEPVVPPDVPADVADDVPDAPAEVELEVEGVPDESTAVVDGLDAVRASAGSCPDTSRTAISDHVAKNSAVASATTFRRIVRVRAARA
jgi:hypothetical protein